MAQIYRQNGDAQPVFALDIQNGSTTATLTSTPALVQMAGPKLQFIALVVENGSNQAIDLRAELGNTTDPGVVQVINQAVQQTSTIAFYQVEPTTTGQISYGVYPTAGFADATALGNAVLALGNVQITNSSGQTRGVNVSGSQSTDVGFKLALS
jgi:hypothetical protein